MLQSRVVALFLWGETVGSSVMLRVLLSTKRGEKEALYLVYFFL